MGDSIIGFLLIIIGIGAIYFAYKYPMGNNMLLGEAKGYIGGGLAILLGILFIIGYFHK